MASWIRPNEEEFIKIFTNHNLVSIDTRDMTMISHRYNYEPLPWNDDKPSHQNFKAYPLIISQNPPKQFLITMNDLWEWYKSLDDATEGDKKSWCNIEYQAEDTKYWQCKYFRIFKLEYGVEFIICNDSLKALRIEDIQLNKLNKELLSICYK